MKRRFRESFNDYIAVRERKEQGIIGQKNDMKHTDKAKNHFFALLKR